MHIYNRSKINIDSNSSLSIICNMIERGASVLDIGCGTGVLGDYLSREKDCVVDGVDINPEQLKIAEKYYRNIFEVDLESEDIEFAEEKLEYDYVICADVIEHIKNSDRVIARAKKNLKSGGSIIFSVPNIAYIGVLLGLLKGEFQYTKEGLLDETHIKFFTYNSLMTLLGRHSLVPVDIERSMLRLGQSEFRYLYTSDIPRPVYRYLSSLKESSTYQFIVKCNQGSGVGGDEAGDVTSNSHLYEKDENLYSFCSQLYWKVHDDIYEEIHSDSCRMVYRDKKQNILLQMPALESEIDELRLDVADESGLLDVFAIRVLDSEGALLWSYLDEKDADSVILSDMRIVNDDLQDGSVRFALVTNDPYMILPVSPEWKRRIKNGATVEVEMAWSINPDFMFIFNKVNDEIYGLNNSISRLHSRISELEKENAYLQKLNLELVDKGIFGFLRRAKSKFKTLFSKSDA